MLNGFELVDAELWLTLFDVFFFGSVAQRSMSSISIRDWEVWKSSRVDEYTAILGAFCFVVAPTLMVAQTVQFLAEWREGWPPAGLILPFLQGARYWNPQEPTRLFWFCSFSSAAEFHAFDLATLAEAVRQLELHTDVNLTYNQVVYLADDGRGPATSLLTMSRRAFGRGYALEVGERGGLRESICGPNPELLLTTKVAQQHYSTGMALLAGEDAVSGLLDAAFIQFYLSLETLLEAHRVDDGIKQARKKYGARFTQADEKIVRHVYLVRHRFFGHAQPKATALINDGQSAFQIAKQALVARWMARRMMALETGVSLVCREMRLYSGPGGSAYFAGDPEALSVEFTLP